MGIRMAETVKACGANNRTRNERPAARLGTQDGRAYYRVDHPFVKFFRIT